VDIAQLIAHEVGQCILCSEGGNAHFPHDFGEDLYLLSAALFILTITAWMLKVCYWNLLECLDATRTHVQAWFWAACSVESVEVLPGISLINWECEGKGYHVNTDEDIYLDCVESMRFSMVLEHILKEVQYAIFEATKYICWSLVVRKICMESMQ